MNDIQNPVNVLLALVLAFFGWLGRKYVAKIDTLERDKADHDTVTLRMQAIEERLQHQDDESERRHTENTQRMDRILMLISRGRRDD
jgi:hypothetical protein